MTNEMWSYDTYSAGWSSRQVRDFRHIFMKLENTHQNIRNVRPVETGLFHVGG
jgi:hypothetical protein